MSHVLGYRYVDPLLFVIIENDGRTTVCIVLYCIVLYRIVSYCIVLLVADLSRKRAGAKYQMCICVNLRRIVEIQPMVFIS